VSKPRSRRRLVSLALAVVASVVVGYFVLAQLKWQDLVALRAQGDLRCLALGFAAYSAANLLRAARFRALTGDQISITAFLRTVLIQNLLNTFLPLRAGEASYLVMVHRSGAVKASDNIGSLLGARMLDLLAALLVPVIALPLSHAWSRSGLPLGWVLAPPALGLAAAALGLRYAEWLADFVGKRATTSRAWLNRALNLASDVLRSLAQLRGSRLLGRVSLLTVACWVLIYLCGYWSLAGVGLKLNFFDCVFAYSFPVVASMMPFFMLGGFGVYEGSLGMGLRLVGVPLSLATAASLALHVAELLFIVLPAPLTLVPRLWGRTAARDSAG
jgi:glycosyltransferase 2 family protein